MSNNKLNTYKYFIFSIKEYFDNQYLKLENRKFESLRNLLSDYIELDRQTKLNINDNDKLKRSKEALLQNILFYLENSALKKYEKFSRDIKNLINIIKKNFDGEDKEAESKTQKKYNNREEIIIHTITPLYKKINNNDIIEIWIDILINHIEIYNDVDKLIDCYVSELLFEGYSLEYLNEWWKEICDFNIIKNTDNEEGVKGIIDKFKLLSKNCNGKYKIILSLDLPKKLKEELKENKFLRINEIEYKFVDKDIYKKDEVDNKFFESNLEYLEVEMKACDRYRALDLSIYNIENYIDIYRVIDNSIKTRAIKQCLFINENKNNEVVSIHNKAKYAKEFTTREKEDIKDFIDLRDDFRRNREDSRVITEIESVINIVHKMSEFTIENKVLNAWSSLEKIVSSYSSPSIIEKVNTIIPKVICMYIIKQKMNHLWDRLLPIIDKLNDENLKACSRKSNSKKYNKERFATYLLRDDTALNLYKKTSSNIVINRNVAEINNLLKNPKALEEHIKFVEQSIRHNINSLYRLRNNIVHNGGKVDIKIEYKIMTLQHYLNCIIGTLIHHIRMNPDLIIEELLHSIVITYNSYIAGIKELEKSKSEIQESELSKKDKINNIEELIIEFGMENIAFIKYLYL
ncbi:hypothetical protein [Clostridium baratii]|uniref:hypothetical protein n=1 Tax=Clostridium baratii TaxID=1561 RepID=UPI001C24B460|nr:hypothetical protein [Clostridium baratii]